jgi:ribosomal protein S27AE
MLRGLRSSKRGRGLGPGKGRGPYRGTGLGPGTGKCAEEGSLWPELVQRVTALASRVGLVSEAASKIKKLRRKCVCGGSTVAYDEKEERWRCTKCGRGIKLRLPAPYNKGRTVSEFARRVGFVSEARGDAYRVVFKGSGPERMNTSQTFTKLQAARAFAKRSSAEADRIERFDKKSRTWEPVE